LPVDLELGFTNDDEVKCPIEFTILGDDKKALSPDLAKAFSISGGTKIEVT